MKNVARDLSICIMNGKVHRCCWTIHVRKTYRRAGKEKDPKYMEQAVLGGVVFFMRGC